MLEKIAGKKGLAIGFAALSLLGGFAAGCGGGAAQQPAAQEQPKEYAQTGVADILNDVLSNAMAANKKYKGQAVKLVDGRVTNIDANGEFITLNIPKNKSKLVITVNPKDKTVKEGFINLRKNQKLTVYGIVKEVSDTKGCTIVADKLEPVEDKLPPQKISKPALPVPKRFMQAKNSYDNEISRLAAEINENLGRGSLGPVMEYRRMAEDICARINRTRQDVRESKAFNEAARSKLLEVLDALEGRAAGLRDGMRDAANGRSYKPGFERGGQAFDRYEQLDKELYEVIKQSSN